MSLNKSAPFSLKLGDQGLLLVGILLLFEFIFLGSLWHLLQQAEKETRREEQAKEILARTSQMMQSFYDAGNAVERYAQTKNKAHEKQFDADIDQAEELIKWLKDAVKDDAHQSEILNRVDGNINQAIVMIKEVVQALDNESPMLAIRLVSKRQQSLHLIEQKLLPDSLELMRVQKAELTKMEADSPVSQRQSRENIKRLLLAAAPINILFALALGVFFTRSITNRLAVLVDNTARMRQGQPLNKLLKGNDEISQLDGVFHDMAHVLRREEDLLKASESRVRRMIEFIPIGLIVINRHGNIEFVNPRTKEMFGFSTEELFGMPVVKLFSASNHADPPTKLQTMIDQSLNRVNELTGIRKDGSEFSVEFSLAEFATEPGEQRLAIVLDVSERYEIQRLRQAFVAMVSHELKTPLTSVRGYLTLLELGAFGELPTDALDGAQRAEKNVIRLITLINDLLDLEKMESGKLKVTATKISLKSVLEQSFDAVRQLAQERQVAIELPVEDLSLYADADRLVQVLVNLLSNAIKFSPNREKVIVEVKDLAETVEFKVIDRGRGVPERFKASIFERFEQVEIADARQKGGTGLGLAVCKAIVEQHGGVIGVDSEEGKGSTFWFRLPKANEES
jgi:PAS domain S-box-containing protein